MKSLRLVSLLRNFGLSQEMVARQDSKAIAATVRAEYLRRAKEQHPDLVPDERKEEAARNFKVLNEEFSETTTLLEEGVRPNYNPPRHGMESAGSNVRQQGFRYHVYNHDYEGEHHSEGPRYPVDRRPQFDTYTRIKCNVIFWTGLVSFFAFMREFLVWSAGSTYSWSRPETMHPFWIRRYKDNWGNKALEDRTTPAELTPGTEECEKKTKADKKKKELQMKKTRDMDEFYTKRRISNVKRTYSPRGMGGVSM